MKKNIWVVYPPFFVLVAAMFLMTVASAFYDLRLFLFFVVISVSSFIFVKLKFDKFKEYLSKVLLSINSSINVESMDMLEKIPIPCVALGEYDEIIECNALFRNTVSMGKDCVGETIIQFLSGHTAKELLGRSSLDVEINESKYTIYGTQLDGIIILYFLENTRYKNITKEYFESRPAVVLALFDNREELKHDSTDGQDAQLLLMVENVLQDWVSKTTGFMKKLNDGKYMIIIEERDLKLAINDNFKILDYIHNIKIDEHRWATLSMGIGRGAKTFSENEQMAKSALDMALGRGGDQVAIKKGGFYKFFGGVSKGVEKRSKVRTRVIASTLSEQISSSDGVLIMGHKFSDLDSIGSAVGLWNVCYIVKNKAAYIVADREHTMAKSTISYVEDKLGKTIFINPDRAMGLVNEKTLLIIVDTHSEEFLESSELYKKCSNIVVIDHHRMMVNHISNAVIFYHEPFASSTAEMVTEIVQYMGDKGIKKLEAECLLAGIMLDTKNFVLKTGVRTFEAAAYLKRKGADPVRVKKMFSNSIETYKLKCKLISNAEIINNCAVTCIENIKDNERVSCSQAADELLDVQNVKASFVLYSSNGVVNISARSMGDVNVQVLMEQMGGGGHQTMAGAQVENSDMDSVKGQLVDIINKVAIPK